jgi:PTS system nitrogen regulatory IIA component
MAFVVLFNPLRITMTAEKSILTLSDAARLLGMPANTLARWIRQGKVPVREEGGEFVFSRKDLVQWAQRRNIFLHRGEETAGQIRIAKDDSVYSAARRGGVFFGVKGGAPDEVLKNAAQLVPLSPEIDKSFVADLLIQREKLASTGVGSGVAIPHPRYPLDALPVPALITSCFLDNALDFKAVDGKPVFILFILLSSTTKLHLHYLSRLSFCLSDPSFLARLADCRDEQTFLNSLEEREALIDEG